MQEMQNLPPKDRRTVDPKLHPAFLLLIVMFVFGMLYGVLLIGGNSELFQTFSLFTGEYTRQQQEQTLLQNFLSSFSSSILFIVIPYLLGYSAIGQPAVLLVPFFKGLGLGAFMGNLYTSQGLQGVGYSVLIIVPYTLVALFAIMIACRESLRLSNLFFASFASRRGTGVSMGAVKLYNIKFLILCVIVLISAILNTVSVLLFARLFHF